MPESMYAKGLQHNLLLYNLLVCSEGDDGEGAKMTRNVSGQELGTWWGYLEIVDIYVVQ
jgi:hypothetical protein